MTKYKYIAVNQYGHVVFIKEFPRKELLEFHRCKHIDKLYRDTKDGTPKHVGYVVGGHWYSIFKLSEWK